MRKVDLILAKTEGVTDDKTIEFLKGEGYYFKGML